MQITILGSGTSGGVPSVTGDWGACDPENPRNRRTRSSVLAQSGGRALLIDTSPDLRQQMLASGTSQLDAVLYTHDHADHVHGIDDLRGFAAKQGDRLPIYADAETLSTLKSRFPYIFRTIRGYPAICRSTTITGPFRAAGMSVTPFEQQHGTGVSLGFRIGDFAYSTDLNALPETAFDALKGVRLWVVDALRYRPHPTHAHLDLTLSWIDRIRPHRAILTHLATDMDYTALTAQLPPGVEVAYDGMTLTL